MHATLVLRLQELKQKVEKIEKENRDLRRSVFDLNFRYVQFYGVGRRMWYSRRKSINPALAIKFNS